MSDRITPEQTAEPLIELNKLKMEKRLEALSNRIAKLKRKLESDNSVIISRTERKLKNVKARQSELRAVYRLITEDSRPNQIYDNL